MSAAIISCSLFSVVPNQNLEQHKASQTIKDKPGHMDMMTIWWIGDVDVSVFSGDISSLERSSVITGWWIDSIFQTNCWHPHNNSHARAKIFNGKSRKKIPHIYWPILWCQGSFVLLRCFHLISIDTWQIWILVFKQYIYKLTSKAKIILKTCRHNRRWSCVR